MTGSTGLIGVPTSYAVTAGGSVAGTAGVAYTFVSGNNLVVQTTVTPASGTNNVKYAWRAACSS